MSVANIFQDVKVRIIENGISPGYDVYFYIQGKDGIDVIYEDRIMRLNEGEVPEKPSIVLNRSAISGFLEAAQKLGFLQDKVKESENVLKVKDDHLQDMRKLVFKGGE